ncbi:RNA-directed DNA polymerase from mobile element jockey [Trichonephila clavipes]|nr:RNA-directed DNA polymerase from mobile element jockey [Trichonephila clavipes]
MDNLLVHLNESRTSDDSSNVIKEYEELDTKLREFPFNHVEEQSAALRSLSDVLDEKPGRKATETEDEGSAKKQRTDITSTENRFAQLSVEEMDITAQAGTSTQNEVPGAAALPKKHHVPPITIDNVSNQAGLLKHLQDLTKIKLEAKLIGSKLRIFPQTAYAYHLIRKYIEENSLESYTYILPDKKLRLVIRGLPTDMSPIEIIGSLAGKNITVNECHIMTSKKTGKEMPLFLITMDKTEENKAAYHVTEIGYMKVKIESLRPKYGPPNASVAKASFTPADSALAHPDANPRNKIEKEDSTNKKATKPVKTTFTTPAPPKVNFWEQRAKNATPLQQPNPITSKKPSQATPSAAPSSVESAEDIFDQLNSPAVKETFDLLEEFIKIATTIPTKARSAPNLPEPRLRPRRRRLECKACILEPHTQQNVAGNIIRRFCDSTGYSLVAPPEPTRFHRSCRSTTIDIAICKGMTVTDCSSIPELSSDHNPVLFEVSLDNYTSPALSIYSFPNWYKFQDILTNTLPGNPRISNPNDIENAIKNFNDCYNSALSIAQLLNVLTNPSSLSPSSSGKKLSQKIELEKHRKNYKKSPT